MLKQAKNNQIEAIPQMEPWFDEKEAEAVFEYMKSGGWVTEFKKTREFEEMVREYVGSDFCSIVSSGTAGLVLALLAVGVEEGDEVIVPDFTMVASANAVKLAGGKVVFTDIEESSLCLDLDKLKEKVTDKTKAVVLVTINGRYPDKMEELVSYCKDKNIKIVEDAAQSLGSRFKGKHLGTWGDIGVFSFSMPKIVTTGQGGAIVTNNKELIDKVRLMRDFGRESGGADHYLAQGWNFKFTDLQAVIGIEQMKKIKERVVKKKEIFKRYRENLKGVKDIEILETNLENTTPWFVDILVKNNKKQDLLDYLKANNIGSRFFYPALHAEPVYNRKGESYPVSEKVAAEGLWLPSASQLTDAQIDRVSEAVKDFFN